MVYPAFILSLWSAVLSTAGLFGQLYYRLSQKPQPWIVQNPHVDVIAMAHPKLIVAMSFGLFFLPVFVSSFLILRHIKRTGKAESLIFTSLCLNTFSLFYGLFLYGALR